MFGYGFQNYRLGTRAIPTPLATIPYPLYVDSEAASGGIGTESDPLNSLTQALTMATGRPNWVIKVKAPATTPFRVEPVAFQSTEPLFVEAWDSLEPWHLYGSEKVSAWVSEGGGVYSKNLGWTTTNMAVVETMTEVVGDRIFNLKLIPTQGVQSSPAQGELGFSAGVVYIRLPGDADPNLHTIEVARRNTGLRAWGLAPITIRHMIGRYFLSAALSVGISTGVADSGYLVAEDCLIEYSGLNGVIAQSQNMTTVCTRVQTYRCANDGFNHRRLTGDGVMILNDCDGSYNGDRAGQSAQGCSSHTDAKMVVNGGRYNWNVSGGMVSVDSCEVNLHGDTIYGPVLMDRNMRLGNTAGTVAGQASCAWMNTTYGTVTGDIVVSNGQGTGVRVATPGNVVGVGTIQSIGNALPDSY